MALTIFFSIIEKIILTGGAKLCFKAGQNLGENYPQAFPSI